MTKKLLSVFLAALMMLGIFGLAAAAEDPAEPTYTPVAHNIADIVAAYDNYEDYTIMPTDTIVLDAAVPAVDGADEEEPAEESKTLIVEYLPGDNAASLNGMDKFADYDVSGYAVLAIGGYTDYAYKGGVRTTRYAIDYQNKDEFAFKDWKVVSVYNGDEFARVTLEAEWDVPALEGWSGFITMLRGYLKTFVDYMTTYFAELFNKLAALVGN